jgi:hypothetical protein
VSYKIQIAQAEFSTMSESEALFGELRQSADAGCVAAIEELVREGADRDLCRINVLAFAAARDGRVSHRGGSAYLAVS